MDYNKLSDYCQKKTENLTYEDAENLLKTWANCPNLSIRNALMVVEQLGYPPRHLKAPEEWTKMGVKINPDANPIKIWVPKMELNQQTKKMERTGMELKDRIDITQTNAKWNHPNIEVIATMLIRFHDMKLLNDPKYIKTDAIFEKKETGTCIIFNKEKYKQDCKKNPNHAHVLLKAVLKSLEGREGNVLTDMLSYRYLGEFFGYTKIYFEWDNIGYSKDTLEGFRKKFSDLSNQIIKLQNHYDKKSQLKIQDSVYIPTQYERDTAVLEFLQRVAMESEEHTIKKEALSILQTYYLRPELPVSEEHGTDPGIE